MTPLATKVYFVNSFGLLCIPAYPPLISPDDWKLSAWKGKSHEKKAISFWRFMKTKSYFWTSTLMWQIKLNWSTIRITHRSGVWEVFGSMATILWQQLHLTLEMEQNLDKHTFNLTQNIHLKSWLCKLFSLFWCKTQSWFFIHSWDPRKVFTV